MPQAVFDPVAAGGKQVFDPVAAGGKAIASPPAVPAPDDRNASMVAADQLESVRRGLGISDEMLNSPLQTLKKMGRDFQEHPLDSAASAAWNIIKAPVTIPYNAAKSVATETIPSLVRDTSALIEAYGGPHIMNAATKESEMKGAEGAGQALAAAPVIAGDVALAKKGFGKLKTMLTTPKIPLSAAEVNKWMTVEPSDVAHGANPGRRVLDEGLLQPTKELTQAAIKPALQQAGQNLEGYLKGAGAQGVEIDGTNIVDKALDSAVGKLKSPTDASFQNSLDSMKAKILKFNGGDIDKMTPIEAHKLKVYIGDNINWKTDTFDPLNDALKDMYHGLNNEIQAEVTGIGDLQKRWGDLYISNKRIGEAINENAVGRGTPGAAPTAQTPLDVLKAKGVKWGVPAAVGFGLGAGAKKAYNVLTQP